MLKKGNMISYVIDYTRGQSYERWHRKSLKRGNATRDRETEQELHASLKIVLWEAIRNGITSLVKKSNWEPKDDIAKYLKDEIFSNKVEVVGCIRHLKSLGHMLHGYGKEKEREI